MLKPTPPPNTAESGEISPGSSFIGLLQGPTVGVFLMGEVPVYLPRGNERAIFSVRDDTFGLGKDGFDAGVISKEPCDLAVRDMHYLSS